MAMCLRFTCDKCGFYQEGWDEGNPYIEFPKGKRNYYYHPGNEIKIGNLYFKIDNPETSDNEIVLSLLSLLMLKKVKDCCETW
ncbi:MAG: hypothetical protein QNK30_13805 [Bacteroidales bacterium]|nr:hypothetical protein [Bacteroidales bacterium]